MFLFLTLNDFLAAQLFDLADILVDGGQLSEQGGPGGRGFGDVALGAGVILHGLMEAGGRFGGQLQRAFGCFEVFPGQLWAGAGFGFSGGGKQGVVQVGHVSGDALVVG